MSLKLNSKNKTKILPKLKFLIRFCRSQARNRMWDEFDFN